MVAGDIFIDTNILVYAHDVDAGTKHEAAKACVIAQWRAANLPSVSVQVLQELYVNLVAKKTAPDVAREMVSDYSRWNVIMNDVSLLTEGMHLHERLPVSFWDALILAAAKRANARVLWSEDLNPGQIYDGVEVVNPLVER